MTLFERLFLGTVLSRLDALQAQIGTLMATAEDLQTKLDAINQAITEERTEVQGMLGALRDQIQSLQDQLNGGQLISQAQLDSLASAADSIVDRVRSISDPVPA